MTTTKLLIGSLSNDLHRVATLAHKGSDRGATRFFAECKKWTADLSNRRTKKYIKDIIEDIRANTEPKITPETAEKYLMYSVLLQNYALHID